jgi:hypothetical protein
MNATSKLERVRDLAKSKMLELQPFAGEEMSLPHTDSRRDSFIEGERTFAAQILGLLDEKDDDTEVFDPMEEANVSETEEKMVLGR